MKLLKLLAASIYLASAMAVSVSHNPEDVEGFFGKSESGHTNNWAVLVLQIGL